MNEWLKWLEERGFLYDPNDNPGGDEGDDGGGDEGDDGGGDGGGGDDRLSRSFSKLAEREREVEGRLGEIRRRERELREYNEIRELARTSPQEVLSRLQINPISLGDALFDQGGDDPDVDQRLGTVQEELKELRQWRKQREQKDAMDEASRAVRRAIRGAKDAELLNMALESDRDGVTQRVLAEAWRRYERDRVWPNYAEIISDMEEKETNNAMALLERLGGAKSVRKAMKGRSGLLGREDDEEEVDDGEDGDDFDSLTNRDDEAPRKKSRYLMPQDDHGYEARRSAFLRGAAKGFVKETPRRRSKK